MKRKWGRHNLGIKLMYGDYVANGTPPLLDEMVAKRSIARTMNVYLTSTDNNPVRGNTLRIPLNGFPDTQLIQRYLAQQHIDVAPTVQVLVNIRRHGRHIRSFMASHVQQCPHYIEMRVELDLPSHQQYLAPMALVQPLRQTTLWEYMNDSKNN